MLSKPASPQALVTSTTRSDTQHHHGATRAPLVKVAAKTAIRVATRASINPVAANAKAALVAVVLRAAARASLRQAHREVAQLRGLAHTRAQPLGGLRPSILSQALSKYGLSCPYGPEAPDPWTFATAVLYGRCWADRSALLPSSGLPVAAPAGLLAYGAA